MCALAQTRKILPRVRGTVQQYFEEICQRQMKDMVSNARISREQPKWIDDILWTIMTEYWDTEEAQQRSLTYSNARFSDRKGLGPHIHLSWPKSYQQIKQEMHCRKRNWEDR